MLTGWGKFMSEKTIQESISSISNVMLPSQANAAGNVHGGEIMKLMDTAASVAAMKHCRSNVVTLRVDELIFHQPIYVGELVTVNSKVGFVGRTSMEIQVEVCVETMTQKDSPRLAQTAFFTFVALNEEGKSAPVPRLLLTTPEEKKAFAEGEERYLLYKKRPKNKVKEGASCGFFSCKK